MAPACFGAIISYTGKHALDGESRNSVVVFLVHIKDIILATRVLFEPEWPFR